MGGVVLFFFFFFFLLCAFLGQIRIPPCFPIFVLVEEEEELVGSVEAIPNSVD